MADLTGTIAKFVIPSDSVGNPSKTIIDWANSRYYLLGSGGQRSYLIDPTATQNPILSVVGAPNPGFQPVGAGCDGAGNILWQGGSTNSQTVFRLSPSTLVSTASYGANNSALQNYPTNIDASESICCITCNSVSYVLCKSLTSGDVNILRTDTMVPAGATFIVSASFRGRAFMVPGISSASTATAYFIDKTQSGAAASVNLYRVTIVAGAENYNIILWPTPNPDITSGLITTLAASTIDAEWSTLTTNTLGYDLRSGLIIADVSSGTATTVRRYLLGIVPSGGGIAWRYALPTGVNLPMDLTQTRIQNSQLPYLNSSVTTAPIYAVQTGSGAANAADDVVGIGAGDVGFNTYADDLGKVFIVNATYTKGSSNPQPVSGTPNSGIMLAMLKVWPSFPAAPTDTATVADLFFSPTNTFVDLTHPANRRLFVSQIGAAQNLGTDGSRPLSVAPPVFLTSNGTPATFATNNGRGGAMPLSGGSLTTGASNPPGASETNTTYPDGAAGRSGVLGDYLTGNLYAFNPATLTDNGTQRRWVRRWRALPAASEETKRFAALVIGLQTGDNIADGAAPRVMLRWSDDGGGTWSDQRIAAVGKLGETTKVAKFNRLGMTRRFGASDRIFELSSSDPFAVAIVDAEVDVS